jgi:hypothetical protein
MWLDISDRSRSHLKMCDFSSHLKKYIFSLRSKSDPNGSFLRLKEGIGRCER